MAKRKAGDLQCEWEDRILAMSEAERVALLASTDGRPLTPKRLAIVAAFRVLAHCARIEKETPNTQRR